MENEQELQNSSAATDESSFVVGPHPPLFSEESSISDTEPDVVESEIHHPFYYIEEQTSNKGKIKLFDNAGFEYNFHRQTKAGATWRCAVRNKRVKCGVLVHQKGSEFFRSSNKTHCHPPKIGAKEAAKLAIKSKKEGVKQPFTPAEKIIRDVIRSEILPAKCEALPDMQCMLQFF